MVYPVALQAEATSLRIDFYAMKPRNGEARLKRLGDTGEQPEDESSCSEAGHIAINTWPAPENDTKSSSSSSPYSSAS